MFKRVHFINVSGQKNPVRIDFFATIENGKTFVEVVSDYSIKIHHIKVFYRPERTWNDHMGNTPCGYYCNVPMPNGKKKRVYMFS